ncbi:MAG TPA: ATP-dependent helicase HrpB [Phycisphaerales bacterium]|nr:ATP-dependent helicase HrpB [Phycisphaerales bacterium]HMP36642.1 ATP-dependent helicase HrpB [Phycisphaerales bacterium]
MASAERLPILAHAEAIVASLAASNRLVLSAPTGSGKTTQVPQLLFRAGAAAGLDVSGGAGGSPGRIVVLQPRRLATRMVARRVADELGVELGGLVGYRTRHESMMSDATRIAFLTEGLFLRLLLDRRAAARGAELGDLACVVLDEFHERSVDADCVLGLVKRLQESTRPELRLVVMSATLDVDRLRGYLEAPAIAVEGRLHPVEIAHVRVRSPRPIWEQAAEATAALLERREGGPGASGADGKSPSGRAAGAGEDVLVFMPGAFEINRTIQSLRRVVPGDVELRALHGALPPREQDAAVGRAASGGRRRRVIVATNVAETSLTIEGIGAVVDSGLARIHRHDPARGINVLSVAPVSRASADQRAGRAGRLGPGRCIRLWPVGEHAQRAATTTPEIQRLELSGPLLQLAAMDLDAREFPWLDPPSEAAVAGGVNLLRRLGAIDADGRITDAGRRMVLFPVHPRLARFLVDAAQRGCFGRAAIWAALAAERDFFAVAPPARALLEWLPEGEPASDLVVRERLLLAAVDARFDPEFLRRHGLSDAGLRAVWRTVEQIRSIARRARLPPSLEDGGGDGLVRSLLGAFADHIAVKLDPARPHAAMAGRRRVVLDEESVLRRAGPLVALELREIGRGDTADVALGIACAVEEEWLQERFPDRFEVVVEDRWNAKHSASEKVERRLLRLDEGELELGRRIFTGSAAHDTASASAQLAEQIASGELRLRRWDDSVEAWLRRVRLVARLFPERGIIRFDPDDLRVVIAEIVGDATRLSAIEDRPVLDAFRGALSWSDARFVDEMAPEWLPLPSGRRLRIEYPEASEGSPPIGRARIQELYGLDSTPTIAAGRQPIVIEILAPNHRPVQRTADLANFWKTLYPELRKELRRRYPRHEWR